MKHLGLIWLVLAAGVAAAGAVGVKQVRADCLDPEMCCSPPTSTRCFDDGSNGYLDPRVDDDDTGSRPPSQGCDGAYLAVRLYVDDNNNGTFERSDLIDVPGDPIPRGGSNDCYVRDADSVCVDTAAYEEGACDVPLDNLVVRYQALGRIGRPKNVTMNVHNICIGRADRHFGPENALRMQAATLLAEDDIPGDIRNHTDIRVTVEGLPSGYTPIKTEYCTNGLCYDTPTFSCGLNVVDILLRGPGTAPRNWCQVRVDGVDAVPSSPYTVTAAGPMATVSVETRGRVPGPVSRVVRSHVVPADFDLLDISVPAHTPLLPGWGLSDGVPLGTAANLAPDYLGDPPTNAPPTHYHYVIGQSFSANNTEVTYNMNVQLPPGDYIFTCNAGTWPNSCGGNPYVEENGTPGVRYEDYYSNWYSCSGTEDNFGGDNVAVRVLPAGQQTISGTILEDVGNDCEANDGEAGYVNSDAGFTVEAVSGGNTYSGGINSNGIFSIAVLDGTSYAVEPVGVPTGFVLCNNPPSFPGTRNVNVSGGNVADVDFLIQPVISSAWWRTTGGDVHADVAVGDNTIFNNLPLGGFMSLADAYGDRGMMSTRADLDNVWLGLGQWRDDGVDFWKIKSAYEPGIGYWVKEDQDYFVDLLNLPADPVQWTDSFDLNGKPNELDPVSPLEGVYVYGGDLTIGDWGGGGYDVPAGETYVILVGDDTLGGSTLTFSEDFTVAEGGFAMFVADGDIKFEPGVAEAQGIYISGGVIEVETAGPGTDSVFNGRGVFVGWSGVDLLRVTADDSLPAEEFFYRPDLVLNAPDFLRIPVFNWVQPPPQKLDITAPTELFPTP